MKNLGNMKYVLPVLLLAACGGSKTPVKDIDQMRAQAKTESEAGPVTPQKAPTPPPAVETIKYVQQETIKYVPQEIVKIQEVPAAPGTDAIKVVQDKSNPFLRFFEGAASSAKFRIVVALQGVNMKLAATKLPDGASLVHVTGNEYEIRWTPKFGTIPYNESEIMAEAILTPQLVDAKTPALENTVRGLVSNFNFSLTVKRTAEKPSSIETTGLQKEIREGDTTPFSVTVRIPGLDNNGTKPKVSWSSDASPQAAGVAYREMDGVRYVTSDPSRAGVEYLGDFKWKFNLVFDTKNVPVEEQKAKDGSVMANADTTYTRTVIDIVPGGFFTAPASIVVKVAIKRNSRQAPEPVPAPVQAAPPVAAKPPVASKPPAKTPAPKVEPKKVTPKTPPKKA